MYLPQNDGGSFELTPAGAHPAICYRFVDLGTQQSTYMGAPRIRHEVMLSWEIADPEIRMADGRPFTIGRFYTWSMSEKSNLRKDLESWRGAPFNDVDMGGPPGGFDIKNIVGKPCLINVTHSEKQNGGGMRDNIAGIMRLPKGVTTAPLVNETVYIALTVERFDREAFAKLSENLQNKIKASPEYQKLSAPAQTERIVETSDEFYSDPIPF